MAKVLNTDYAYDKGRDAVLNGANTENCHYTLFASPEFRDAWERGHKDGKAQKERQAQATQSTKPSKPKTNAHRPAKSQRRSH